MQEILDRAKEFLGLLQQKISKYDILINDTTARLAAQDKELAARLSNILAREQKIGPAEQVIALREQAIKEKNEADALLKSVRKEKQEFADKMAAESAAMEKAKDLIKIDRAKADNEMAKSQKEWIALKKEQETWKAKFIEEVKNKVK